jgi:hypothetical protein
MAQLTSSDIGPSGSLSGGIHHASATNNSRPEAYSITVP